ncbi:MAG: IPT/TIG domain-containing protein [Planctomycetes bacterium]|nr:IPT/TIG domain-containing protein [Planctomycetota bacterium]
MIRTALGVLLIPLALGFAGCGGGSGGGSHGTVAAVGSPSVQSVSPAFGQAGGGTFLTIRGANFTSQTKVLVGGQALTNPTCVDNSTFTGLTPAGTKGDADVVVTTAGGTATFQAGYTYGPPITGSLQLGPLLTSGSETVGPLGGRVSWPGFVDPATGAQISGGTLTIPAGAMLGDVDIRVEIFPAGQALPGSLVYKLSPSGLSFSSPSTLEFGYADSWVSQNKLDEGVVQAIVVSDATTEALHVTGRDPSNNRLSVLVPHFSSVLQVAGDKVTGSSETLANFYQPMGLLDATGAPLVDDLLRPLDPNHPFWLAGDVAVVVHGFSSSPAKFDQSWLKAWLSSRYDAVAFARYPSADGISANAQGLASMLAHRTQGVHLFGHSMGGLLCRTYLETLNPNGRVASLVTFGSPHEGAPLADIAAALAQLVDIDDGAFGNFQGAQDLRVGSSFLANLNSTKNSGSPPYFVVIADDDFVVRDNVSESGERVLNRERFFLADTSLLRPFKGHSDIYNDDQIVGTTYPGLSVRDQVRAWMATQSLQSPPNAPAALVATAASQNQIDLEWQDRSIGEDGFRIERRIAGTWATVKTVGPGSSQGTIRFRDENLSAGTTYRYRVSAFNAAGDSPHSNEASATTPPATPPPPLATITVDAPNGGESLTLGTSTTARWSSTNYQGNVRVEVLLNGNVFATLATSHANTGSLNFTPAANWPSGGGYTLRVSGSGSSGPTDTSDGTFSVNAAAVPSITVLSPNGGEILVKGTTFTIRWSTSNFGGAVQIHVYRNDSYYATIAANHPNTGSVGFNPPGNWPDGNTYQIGISAAGTGSPADFSDANFSITSALPNLTCSVSGPTTIGRGVVYFPNVTVQRTGGSLNLGTYALVRVWLTSPTKGTWLCSSDSDSSSQFPNVNLNASGSAVQAVLCVPPAGMPTGNDYTWRVEVDPTGFHAESNESDNTATGAGSVSVQ